MTDRLTGIYLRLERANEHLSRLDDERTRFLHDEEREVVGHFEPDTSEYVFCITGQPPPTEWGIVVGEFAHNLRASLDNLVWALVGLRGGVGTNDTQFVIADTPDAWRRQTTYNANRRRGDRLRGISAEDRALIKALQPYQRANPLSPLLSFAYASHPLNWLAWLNNVEKHRVLHAAFSYLRVMGLPLTLNPFAPDNDTTGGLLKDSSPRSIGTATAQRSLAAPCPTPDRTRKCAWRATSPWTYRSAARNAPWYLMT